MLSCMGSFDSWHGGLQSQGYSSKRKESSPCSITIQVLPEGLVTSRARGDEGERRPIRNSDWGSRKQVTVRVPKRKTENETPGHCRHSR